MLAFINAAFLSDALDGSACKGTFAPARRFQKQPSKNSTSKTEK
jgi:hypothetical protein